ASEDEQGLPFVGRAGKLLDQLLGEIGLGRKDVFVANVLKCRPPGNRDPLPIEIENCQDYLLRQVELIQPAVICTLGNFSTKLLRGDPTGISRLHGQPEVRVIGSPGGGGSSRNGRSPPSHRLRRRKPRWGRRRRSPPRTSSGCSDGVSRLSGRPSTADFPAKKGYLGKRRIFWSRS